jgi:hypothetical protein
MTSTAFSSYSFWRAAVLACAIALASAGQPAAAATGPFGALAGSWDGTGKIRIGDKTERIRCKASYDVPGSTASNVGLSLICASDSYKFDLSGNFQADDSNRISGNWSERSRGVGGSASGSARGDRFQLHVDSSAFSGNVILVTRGNSQSVSIDTIGTEDKISATITLRKGSR